MPINCMDHYFQSFCKKRNCCAAFLYSFQTVLSSVSLLKQHLKPLSGSTKLNRIQLQKQKKRGKKRSRSTLLQENWQLYSPVLFRHWKIHTNETICYVKKVRKGFIEVPISSDIHDLIKMTDGS